jgi:hypothetical protein
MKLEDLQKLIDSKAERKCNSCNEMLPVTEFYLKKDKNENHYRFNSPCKFCSNLNRNVNYQKAYHRKVKYGLSQEDYDKMLKDQNYCCDICKIHKDDYSKDFAVDHCHDTGKVRGLLCTNCNLGIGNAKHSIKILKSCIKYLEKHNKLDKWWPPTSICIIHLA